MNNTGLATKTVISIVTQEVISEASIRDHQHGEDPGSTLRDQWPQSGTTGKFPNQYAAWSRHCTGIQSPVGTGSSTASAT